MRLVLLLLLFSFASCGLFSPYRNGKFTYTDENGVSRELRLKVPRGFKIKTESKDSAGNKELVYRYVNGAVYYAAFSTDTMRTYQPIDETLNQPLPHRSGGWIYKGQDSSHYFWREIRMRPLTFGYRNVSRENEVRFDSALNYSSLFLERNKR